MTGGTLYSRWDFAEGGIHKHRKNNYARGVSYNNTNRRRCGVHSFVFFVCWWENAEGRICDSHAQVESVVLRPEWLSVVPWWCTPSRGPSFQHVFLPLHSSSLRAQHLLRTSSLPPLSSSTSTVVELVRDIRSYSTGHSVRQLPLTSNQAALSKVWSLCYHAYQVRN